jgi:hypothetical protein
MIGYRIGGSNTPTNTRCSVSRIHDVVSVEYRLQTEQSVTLYSKTVFENTHANMKSLRKMLAKAKHASGEWRWVDGAASICPYGGWWSQWLIAGPHRSTAGGTRREGKSSRGESPRRLQALKNTQGGGGGGGGEGEEE